MAPKELCFRTKIDTSELGATNMEWWTCHLDLCKDVQLVSHIPKAAKKLANLTGLVQGLTA